MKMNFTKNIDAERKRGRDIINKVYLTQIDALLGPASKLYAAKYADARTMLLLGVASPLISEDEAHTIIQKYEVTMSNVKVLEDARQATQAKIDAAKTAHEVDQVVLSVFPTGLPGNLRNFK